ncbi:hypothetical protein V2J09_013361 [Rumex salicifolius]
MKIIQAPKVCLLPRPFQNPFQKLSKVFFFVKRDSNFFSIGGRLQLVKKLESKVFVLNITLNHRQKELKGTNEEELAPSSLECFVRENLALAKELAALKLLSDFNLGEEEILKLATLGNEFNGARILLMPANGKIITSFCTQRI